LSRSGYSDFREYEPGSWLKIKLIFNEVIQKFSFQFEVIIIFDLLLKNQGRICKKKAYRTLLLIFDFENAKVASFLAANIIFILKKA